MASHDVGKTFLSGVAANWWYDCWTSHIVYITAPTWDQALGLTFKAVKTQRRERQLPGRILDTGYVRDEDKLREGSHYIRAFNAEKGEGFQGEHEAPILIILEEGVGVPKYIWDAATGLMGHEDCRLLVIGNPTDESTEFGKAAEDPKYNVITICGLNHPNIQSALKCEPSPFPKAISLRWIFEMLQCECERVEKIDEDAFEWHALPEVEKALNGAPVSGEQWVYKPTATFQGRVLGMFPTQADQNVIPKSWIKNLSRIALMEQWHPELGCDVAHFGDDRTTIFMRRGPCLLRAREIRKMDTVEVATACRDEAIEAVRQWKPNLPEDQRKALAKRVPIKVDVTGGLGAGPCDLLKSQHKDWGYNAIAINSSERANDTEQFANTRSELWWTARLRAKDKRLDISRLPKEICDKLTREWSAPKYKSPGQKIVEKKADMKKRLGYSPDLADGANLSFYDKKESKMVSW